MTSPSAGEPALAACPFCGSPAELEHDNDHHGEWFNLGCSRHWGRVDPDKACPGGRIWYADSPDDEVNAIAAWNRRAAPPATAKPKPDEFDRGMICGIALACSIIQETGDQPRIISEAIGATGLNRAKMKAAGVEDYDLEILKPVFAELSPKPKRKRR